MTSFSATTRSAFGLAEVKRNLVAGAGGLFRLPRAIGQAPAMEMILTGEPLPATRAYELGLVSAEEPVVAQRSDGKRSGGGGTLGRVAPSGVSSSPPGHPGGLV